MEKHYGYGILRNDGSHAAYSGTKLIAAENHAAWMDKEWPETAPNRVIALFYKDEEQS